VTIKLLPSVLARQPHLRERFLREARTAGGRSHPNVVPIHAVEAHGDVVLFVMGFVDGEPLARRVARRPAAPVRGDARAARRGTGARSRARARRDPPRPEAGHYPARSRSGRALVTDFGITRVEDAPSSLTLDGQVMGTAQHMSPDQAAGEPLDGRSDLYALGAVGCVALTGLRPFVVKTDPAPLAMQVGRTCASSARPGVARRCQRPGARPAGAARTARRRAGRASPRAGRADPV
jgi:serine/threonine-protein kinase